MEEMRDGFKGKWNRQVREGIPEGPAVRGGDSAGGGAPGRPRRRPGCAGLCGAVRGCAELCGFGGRRAEERPLVVFAFSAKQNVRKAELGLISRKNLKLSLRRVGS